MYLGSGIIFLMEREGGAARSRDCGDVTACNVDKVGSLRRSLVEKTISGT